MMRKLHLGEDVWQYKVGKSNLVIRAPNGSKKIISFKELIQVVNPDFLPRYLQAIEEEDDLEFSIEPKDLKQYIEAKASTFVAPAKRPARKGLTRPRR